VNQTQLIIATSTNQEHVDFLVKMINDVYDESESNIWLEGHKRTNSEKLKKVILDKELLLAISGEDIHGCIHLERIDDETHRFKMLVANPRFKGRGIGSKLVDYAENQARKAGSTKMQLELLVPTEVENNDKVFLHTWYTRIGYQKIDEQDIEYIHKGVSVFLKNDCIVKVYEKEL